MKTLIVILIIASFLQTTILPIDLVLLLLICRAYLKSEKTNLYLAFAFGLLTAHLNLTNLGVSSLIYLTLVQITQMLSKLRLAGNPLMVIPLSFLLLFLNQVIQLLTTQQPLAIYKLIIEALLSLPIFYLIRLWEERFVVRKEIKLKI